MFLPKKIIHKKALIFFAVAFCLFVTPGFAHANFVTDWVSSSVLEGVGGMAVIMKGFIVGLIGICGSAIDQVLSIPVTGSDVVKNSWEIVRGFANMFFIIALIIMAFATIFDIGGLQKYNFSSLIARFLIAALLINFSLVIGGIIIDWSQSLANVFKESIGSIGNRIAQGTELAARFNPDISVKSAPTADLSFWNGTLSMFGDIVMLCIILFSLLVMLFFLIVRVPILWALLIISPIAWITYILPTTQKVSKMWWNYFISWNLFLPIYLFFIYFGTYFLSRKEEILGDKTPLLDGYNLSLQTIFFYILTALFLIGGAKIAISYASAGGAGAVAGAIRAKAWGATKWGGSRLPVFGGYSGRDISGAYKEAKQHIQKEGFAGTPFEAIPYRGQRGADEKAATIAGGLGIPGVAERQTQRRIQTAEEKFKNQRLSEEVLNKQLTTGTLEEKIAASNILKGLGQNLKGEDLAPIFDAYRKVSPAEAVRWIRGQNIDNLSRDGLEALEKVDDPQLRQKIARIKAKRQMISDVDSPDKGYNALLSRFDNNEGELVGFLGDSKEFIDGLRRDEALKIYAKIPATFKEAKKKFAMQIAEKGYFDAVRLKELAGTNQDGDNGVFGSTSEAEKFLDLAKTPNPYEVLALRADRETLTDLYAKDSDGKPIKLSGQEGIRKALQQEFDRMDTEKLAKIKSDDRAQTGFANPLVLQAFQDSLNANRRGAEKVKGMYLDPKFYNNAPLVNYLDGALKNVRLNAFNKDIGDPFKAKILNITSTLIPAITKSIEDNDETTTSQTIEKTRGSLKQSERQLSAITNLDFLESSDKEVFTGLLANAQAKFKKIEDDIKSKKNQRPDKNKI